MSIFNGSKPANRPALKRGAASARGTLLMFSAAAALGTLGAGQSAHGDQARSSSVTTWSASCEGSTREWWDDMCMAWRKEMGTKGWSTWWRNFENVIVDRYTDPSISAWGRSSCRPFMKATCSTCRPRCPASPSPRPPS